MFRVGQKVVCINNGISLNDPSLDGRDLVIGAVYAIHRVLPNGGIYLAEVRSAGDGWNGYDPRRFRALIERKTDISVFTSMLNPSKREEKV